MRRALLLTAVLLAFSLDASQSAARYESVRESDVAIPMRDGVILRAEVMRPTGRGPFPALVYRTPYGKDAALKTYTIFARAVERGYVVVIQDVRGRYRSDGQFVAYQNEGRDGYDTIEWAARQPWSNGHVGTFGLSYPGAVQWLAAVEAPPHLDAMVPAMTFASPRKFFYSGGVFDLSWIGWTWNNIAPDERRRRNLTGPRTPEEAETAWERQSARLLGYLPLADLPDLKPVAPWYYEWMEHATGDAWWDWAELQGRYGRVKAAVLNLSGWYDEAYGPDGATRNFSGLMAARKASGTSEPVKRAGPDGQSPGSRTDPRTELIIGPWKHGVDAVGSSVVGERHVGPDAALEYDELVLEWMDHYLRGIDNGVGQRKPVRIYMMGENRWIESDTWPLDTSPHTVYLRSPLKTEAGHVNATDVLNSPGGVPRADSRGMLAAKPGEQRSSMSFVSDPAHPFDDPFAERSGGHDYRNLLAREDALVFQSEPLDENLRVAGAISTHIFVSVDAPDTDLWVRVLDIAPDGTAYNVNFPGAEVIRASYRNTGRGRELLDPGKIYELAIPDILTGNAFVKGHRIAVQISTAFFPHFSRNLHSGDLEFHSARMKKARITIHFGGEHASRIVLPVLGERP